MEVLKLIKDLEAGKEFKEWRKDNKKSYLAHVFMMDDEPNKDSFQLGYFNPDTEKMVTFITSPEGVQVTQEAEVFKKEESKVQPLDTSKIKFNFDHALEKADKLQKEHYPTHSPLKRIVILQNIKEGQVYNLTYVTMSFGVLNIKVGSDDGKVVTHKLTSIIDTKLSK